MIFGFLPRMAVTLTYSYVAGAFLLEIVGSAVALPSWVLNVSVLHHVAPVPAVAVDVRSAVVMLILGGVMAALGIVSFTRRDIQAA